MIKHLKFMLLFMMILRPYSAKADIDFISLVNEKLDGVQATAEQITSEYIGALSLEDLKKFTRGDFSSLKDLGTSFLTEQAMLMGKSLANDMLAQYVYADEIGEHIKGSSMNPELVSAISKNMARKTNAANDVQATKEHNERINDMLVENVASMYATSIVKRKKLMNEQEDIQKEEEASLEEVPSIIAAYKSVSQRANSRWISILEMMSNVEGLKASKMTSETKILDEEAAKKELEEALAEEKQLAQQASGGPKEDLTKRLLDDIRSSTLYKAYKDGSNVYDAYESGDYLKVLGAVTDIDQVNSFLSGGNGKYEAIGPNGEVIGVVDEEGNVLDKDGNIIGYYDETSGTLVSLSGRTIGSLGQEKKNWAQSIYKEYQENKSSYDAAISSARKGDYLGAAGNLDAATGGHGMDYLMGSRQEQAKDKDGNLLFDENGNPVMEEKKSWLQSGYQTFKKDEDLYNSVLQTGSAVYDSAKEGGSLVDMGKRVAGDENVKSALKNTASEYKGSSVEQSVNTWHKKRQEKKKEKNKQQGEGAQPDTSDKSSSPEDNAGWGGVQ